MTEYVVIGDGAAGTTAAQYIRRRDPQGRITIYSDDLNAAYYRAALTNYLIGELREDQLFAVPPDFYERNRIRRVLGRVSSVDTVNGRITLSSGGGPVPYDRLCIAAGSSPNPLPVPGGELLGVMTMRTMQDARTFMDDLRSGRVKRAVVIGGGPLALEWAQGLRARGAEVTSIVRGPELMPGILDRTGSDLVASRLRAFGCDLRMEEEVSSIWGDEHGRVRGVGLKNSGQEVEAQLVCAAIGIRINTAFLQDSGIRVERGIPVDEHMLTNVRDVYAAGDVAEVFDPLVGAHRGLGLWEPARLQGRVAGSNMAGGELIYRVGVSYNATRLYDLDFAGVGRTIEQDGDQVVADLPRGGGTIAYRKLIIRDGKVVGAILLGHRSERVRRHGMRLRKLIEGGTDVSEVADHLLEPGFDLPAWMAHEEGEERVAPPGAVLGGAAPTYSRLFLAPDLASPLSRAISMPPVASMAAPSLLPAPPEPSAAAIAVLEPSPPAARAPGARATLSVEGEAPVEFGESGTIGRGPDNDLVLADPLVSGSHARVRAFGGGYVVEDLGSRNGTYLRGKRVDEPMPLVDGDQIRVGETVVSFALAMPPARADVPVAPEGTVEIGEPMGAAVSGLHVRPDALDVPAPPRDRVLGLLEGAGRRFELIGSVISIGRDPASDLALEDPAVSGTHAQIAEHEGEAYLRDLGSRNGTFVNASLVAIPHALRDGDIVHVGDTDLTFHAAPSASTAEPAPASAAGAPPTPPGEPPAPPPAEAEPRALEPTPVAERAFRLVVEEGPLVGNVFELGKPQVEIGRDPEADVALPEPTVSWRHARLTAHGVAWTVADLGSTNGTHLGGERLEANREIPIDPGAELRLGEVKLRFEGTA